MVDISSDGTKIGSIQAREWLEYTVDVSVTGKYDISIKHQTRRTPAFKQITVSLPDENKTLLSDIMLTNAGTSYHLEKIGNVLLEKGKHVMRITLLDFGFDIDYFELALTSKTIDYVNVGTRNNPDNPYVRQVSIPRLRKFQSQYPELLKDNH